jgi:Predicted AAA-ATPase/PD-(D/E)XK nuclease superfamily
MKNLPLGIQHFDQLVSRGAIYVDKTPLICELLNQYQAVFLARPRRFGKSLLLSTIAQLFAGRKDLFQGLWAENNWDWNRVHPVIHFYMDLTGFQDLGLHLGLMQHLDGIASKDGLSLSAETPGLRLKELIEKLHEKYGKRVVMLVDEYDKPIVDILSQPEQVEENRKILGDFYGVLKPIGDKLEFLMLTGISKFSQVSVFSKLNQLEDISLVSRFSTLLGYTETELTQYFDDYLARARQELGYEPDAFTAQIKHWYNGYSWDAKNLVYNPVSFMRFLRDCHFSNYWFATATPGFLIEQLRQRSYYNIDDLEVSEEVFESYTLQNLDVRVLLFQTGYLTIKSILRHNTYVLGYPNYEVESSLTRHLMSAVGHLDSTVPGPTVFRLRDAFFQNDLEKAISIINTLFENIPGTLNRKKVEADYHAMLYLVFKYMGLEADAEVPGLRGRSDAVLKTPSQVYVIEFKLDQSAQKAIDYLREKGYAEKHRHDGRPVLLLGINFSRKKRVVDDWLVEAL